MGAQLPATKPRALRLSASAYKTFQDCPRKWWYQKVQGLVTPPTPNLTLGTDVHAILEHRITQGAWPGHGQVRMETDDGPVHFRRTLEIAQAGGASETSLDVLARLYARDGYDAYVEARISFAADVLGLPFLGFVDFCEQAHRVVDHKTTGSIYGPWHHTRESLGHDPQLLIYAWALWHGDPPPSDQVMVEHYYYQTKGDPAFRTLAATVPWLRCEATAEAFKVTATQMAALSRVSQSRGVPAKTSACGKYGGCPFADICPIPKSKPQQSAQTHGGSNMSLLERLQAERAKNAPTTTVAPVAPAPTEYAATDVNPPDGPGTESPTSAQIDEAVEALKGLEDVDTGDTGPEVYVWLNSPAGLAFLARHHLGPAQIDEVVKAFDDSWEGPPAVTEFPPESAAPKVKDPAPEDGAADDPYAELVALLKDNDGSESPTSAQIDEAVEALKGLEDVDTGDTGPEVYVWLNSPAGLAFLARHHLGPAQIDEVVKAFDDSWEGPPAVTKFPPESAAPKVKDPAPEDGAADDPYAELVALLKDNDGSVRVTNKALVALIKGATGATRLSRSARSKWLGVAQEAGVVDVSATYVSLPGADHGAIVDAELAAKTVTPAPETPAPPKATPKAPPAQAPPPKAPTPQPISLVIYVDCVPVGHRATPLDEVLAPIYTKVATREGVPSWLLVDYNKGPAMVMAEVQSKPPPTGMVSVRSDHPLAKHLSAMWPQGQQVVALR